MTRINSNFNAIIALALSSAFALSAGQAATLITNNGNTTGTNSKIPDNFGSNIAASNADFEVSAGATGVIGTPDIGLTWTTTENVVGGNTLRWESHAWTNAGGGALQLNGSEGGGVSGGFSGSDIHSITFTPGATSAVQLNSFNFNGDTNNDQYQYDWQVVETGDNSVVASGQTASWTTDKTSAFNGAPQVSVNFTGNLGTEYRFDLAQSDGSTGNSVDIGIDNLSFDQVPESSALGFLGLGALALLRRRRA